MTDFDNLCMGCMKDIGSATNQCPYCGYSRSSMQIAPYLSPGTVIDGRYLIGKRLESNGDGVTYMAWHIDRSVPVTVREFLPDTICGRAEDSPRVAILPGSEVTYFDYMQSFIDLWRKLARMRGLSALIPVFDIVEANRTAYAISEYIEGITLRDYLLRSNTGFISWDQARALFMPVLSTLGALHNAGIIHRGISPLTIIVCRDGKLRLSGFSIRQVRCSIGELNSELVDGYAAIEQYSIDYQQGTWTDVYSFAAVLYRSLIGSIPLDASKRAVNDTLMIPARFAERLPAQVVEALINALQVFPEDRTRSIELMRIDLSLDTPFEQPRKIVDPENRETAPVKTPPPVRQASVNEKSAETQKKETKQSPKKRSGGKTAAITLMIFLLLGAVAFGAYYLGENTDFFNKLPGVSQETTVTEPLKYTVPDFSNKTQATVQSERSANEFFVLTFENKSSKTVEKGYIFEQNVPANSQVIKGTEIILYVSSGPAMIKIPDITGLSYADAAAQLQQLGLVCNESKKFNDGTHEGGRVIDTIPAIGTDLLEGSTVFINVWEMPETQSTAQQTTKLSIFDFF